MVVTAIQINSTPKSDENLKKVIHFLEKALYTHPDIIVFPEYTNYMGPLHKASLYALPDKSRWHVQLSEFAKSNKVHILIGLLLKSEKKKVASSIVLFDKSGECRVIYNKIHLFDIHLDNNVFFRESEFLTPGSEPGSFTLDQSYFGCALCYDLRFPELFRRLCSNNVRAVFLPSAFTDVTGEAHWEVLIRARAIENQMFIIAVNQVGEYPEGKTNYGMSMIVDPWGTVLCRAPLTGDKQSETIITANLDFAFQMKVRKSMPCLSHIRKDLFHL